MRAGLPEKEPLLVKWWQEMRLYKKLRESAAGRPFQQRQRSSIDSMARGDFPSRRYEVIFQCIVVLKLRCHDRDAEHDVGLKCQQARYAKQERDRSPPLLLMGSAKLRHTG